MIYQGFIQIVNDREIPASKCNPRKLTLLTNQLKEFNITLDSNDSFVKVVVYNEDGDIWTPVLESLEDDYNHWGNGYPIRSLNPSGLPIGFIKEVGLESLLYNTIGQFIPTFPLYLPVSVIKNIKPNEQGYMQVLFSTIEQSDAILDLELM